MKMRLTVVSCTIVVCIAQQYKGMKCMTELAFIEKFLKANRNYVLEKFTDKASLAVADKDNPNDLLTEVDLTLQKRFVEAVAKTYSDDVVIGEESGLNVLPQNPDGRVWIIDPIDGTYNFVRGLNPAFAIAIAFAREGFAQAAGVFMPRNGLMFLAEAGAGAYCNGKRMTVSTVQHFDEACMEIDFGTGKNRNILVRRAGDALRQAGQVRCQGSAVVGICQVASGDVDGYLHIGLDPWDYAAAQLVAEEAGALATRLDGEPLRLFDGKQGVLISNGAIHKTVLALLTR